MHEWVSGYRWLAFAQTGEVSSAIAAEDQHALDTERFTTLLARLPIRLRCECKQGWLAATFHITSPELLSFGASLRTFKRRYSGAVVRIGEDVLSAEDLGAFACNGQEVVDVARG